MALASGSATLAELVWAIEATETIIFSNQI
jgi:hypothetical protein